MAEKSNFDKALEVGKIILLSYGVYKIVDIISGATDIVEDITTDDPDDAGHSQDHCGNPNNYSWREENYEMMADQISDAVWNYGFFGVTENDRAIANALLGCWTDDDVFKLACTYGVRGAPDAYSGQMNLVMTVTNRLDDDMKEEVNAAYQQRGMTTYWA